MAKLTADTAPLLPCNGHRSMRQRCTEIEMEFDAALMAACAPSVLRLDRGADGSLVRASLVPEDAMVVLCEAAFDHPPTWQLVRQHILPDRIIA